MEGATLIYLVRHTEKETGDNPRLTEVGIQRAKDLSDFLKEKKVTGIYSTDYLRTQQTARLTAKMANRGVGSYNPSNLGELADKIKTHTGTILVVGHSNTTPKLVEMLGGNPGEPIGEAWEYDRLYELKLQKGVLVSSEILRYGVACQGE